MYAAAAAAAVIAVAWIAWDLRGRVADNRDSSGASLAAAALPGKEAPVIAVLPFKNLSSAPDSDYFADGLTGEIIRNLSLIDGLQVRSHTSSFFFKNKPRNLAEISEQLRANLILDGSVQREGGRLRIQAQLVRAAGDMPVWSDRFDRQITDVFAIQDEISRAIVNRLRLTLGRGQRRYQTNVDAYELYLRARTLLEVRGAGPAAAEKAIKLFEQVIASDPSFAPAYAGLADAYADFSNTFNGLELSKALASMRPAALKALELDPLLAEAHAALGYIHSRELRWAEAEKSFERAIELNRSLPFVYLNYVYSTLLPLGKTAYAEQLLERALQADPLSPALRHHLALVQYVAGRYEEALQNLQRVRALDPKHSVDQLQARALTLLGRLDEALPIWDSRKGTVGWEHWAARAYVDAGRRAEVEQMLPRQKQPFQEAMIYAALRDKDRTLDAVNRSVDAWPHRITIILVLPEMAFVREDARLEAVRKRLRLP